MRFVTLLFLMGGTQAFGQSLMNGDFEQPDALSSWTIRPANHPDSVIKLDSTVSKTGNQSVLISSERLTGLSINQELFLPVGTLWRLSAWAKFERVMASGKAPAIGIDTPSGSQGRTMIGGNGDWREGQIVFRIPSPGRVTIRLIAFSSSSGKVWFDDVQLSPVTEDTKTVEQVTITNDRLSHKPIDLKQGGQFIEPLCYLLSSMSAQQVQSTSFEEETPCDFEYRKAVDQPYRPWYPDGSVHVARYSFDTQNPFNGERSQKIELPLANTWAAISQDGFYLDAGHTYTLKLHVRGEGSVRVRAWLHGAGKTLVEPVALGEPTAGWRPVKVVMKARESLPNATLTIEASGPGTVWLDRVYFIDQNAVLGIWRRDVVEALKAMNPGVIRFGGTTIQSWDWEKCIGDWDKRVPYQTDGWGGFDPNFIGLEEFVALCRYVNAEPLICVRWTGKRPEDAAAEVEYLNGDASTKWGSLRVKNGHAKPYGVKYWQVGNEIDGPEYLQSLKAFAEAMKKADPSINVLSSFPQPHMLELTGGLLDYLCPHDYEVGDLAGNEMEFKRLADQIAHEGRGRDVRVAVTEWNSTGGEKGLHRGMLLTLGNALSCSRYQNLMQRYCNLVEMANRSNLSDSFGSGVIQPELGSLYLTPTYFRR